MPERSHDDPDPIHFECDHCRSRLTVPHDLAGVRGPCPVCGGIITAPAAEVQGRAQVEIKPRPRRPARQDPAAPVSGQMSSPQPTAGEKKQFSSHPGHAVNPRTGLSTEHEEKQDFRIVMKMLFTALMVAVVVALVVFWLRYRV